MPRCEGNFSRRTNITLVALCVTLMGTCGLAGEIAITFDDAPRPDTAHFTGAQRAGELIRNLELAGVGGAIFFAVSGRIDGEGALRLTRYQEAGHFVANHSHSHARPGELGLDAYVGDIRRADAVLRGQPGFLRLYRFPYLDEGREEDIRDGIRAALAGSAYANGYVTVDNYDWYMDALLQRALEAGRPVDYQRLGEVYVDLLVSAVEFYDDVAVDVLGRSPRHVLLLHENDLAAMYVDDLVAELERRGWRIIPGPRAYRDPIAGMVPDTLFNNQGRVAAIAASRGVARHTLVHPAEDEAWLERHFDEQGVFGQVDGTEAQTDAP